MEDQTHWMNCENDLIHLEVNSHLLNGIKSYAQDGYAQGENQN
jgi:hypothetical protein